jgi:hypothetical protein
VPGTALRADRTADIYSYGASDSCTANVTVIDATPPEISLDGEPIMTLECRIDSYTEPGASVADNCDPVLTVVIGGDAVNTSTCGTVSFRTFHN